VILEMKASHRCKFHAIRVTGDRLLLSLSDSNSSIHHMCSVNSDACWNYCMCATDLWEFNSNCVS
jgi:hypothetical protein